MSRYLIVILIRVIYRSQEFLDILGFDVLTPVVMRSSIFWDITPCSPLTVNRSFGKLLATCFVLYFFFLLGLILELEDGGHMFLRKVG
jgi:hypothetical protein